MQCLRNILACALLAVMIATGVYGILFIRASTAVVAAVPAEVDATRAELTREVRDTRRDLMEQVSGVRGDVADQLTALQANVFSQVSETRAVGRALANFQHQDDDPTVNSGADAAWLASAIKTHIDAIRTAVLAVQAGARFELLLPLDVNAGTCYYTADVPYPQGGRMNAAANIPAAYLTKSGSGLDRIKIEGLSWASEYRNFARARDAVRWPYTVGTWSKADTRYLIPWFNGGCDWVREYLCCLSEGITAVNLWAVDHGRDKSQILPV